MAVDAGGARRMRAHAVEVQPGPLRGRVAVPPSKSETHRAFLLAAQSEVPCLVRSPLLADDTRTTLSCLLALGARAHLQGDDVQFLPALLRPVPGGAPLACNNSGTTLRLLAATCARWGQPTTLTGDASLSRRSSSALLDALRALGAHAEAIDGCPPITVGGPLQAGTAQLPANTSSQFASALLLSLPFLAGPSTLHLAEPIASQPYLDVTQAALQAFGLRVERTATGFAVPGNQRPRATTVPVGGDWSAAAFALVGAAITQGDVTVTGLDPVSAQGDRRITTWLQRFGADVHLDATGVRVRAAPLQSPGVVDVAATPDLFPALAALAACAQGTTTFTGGANLRHKESDRLATVAAGLQRLGADARLAGDDLTIHGGRPLHGAHLSSHGDHRIHMALCIAALAARGPSKVDGPASAAVSYPGFHADLQNLGADLRLLQGNREVVA